MPTVRAKNQVWVSLERDYPVIRRKLLAYADQFVPRWADEIVDQAIMKCWQASRDGRQLNLSYYYQAVTNVYRDILRHNKARPEEMPLLINHGINDTYHTDDLAPLLNQLSPSERDLVTLRMAGYQYQEIARRWGRSTEAIKRRAYVLRQRLREQWRGEKNE